MNCGTAALLYGSEMYAYNHCTASQNIGVERLNVQAAERDIYRSRIDLSTLRTTLGDPSLWNRQAVA